MVVLAVQRWRFLCMELVQAETEFSSLKADVMMTANRCSDLTFFVIMIVFRVKAGKPVHPFNCIQ